MVALGVPIGPGSTSAAAGALAADGIHFASPKPDQLVTGKRLRVEVHVPRGSSGFRADLDGTDVSSRFTRIKPAVWAARLSRSELVTGANHLRAQTLDAAGHQASDLVRFYKGRRDNSLLQVKSRNQASGNVPVSFSLGAEPDLKLRATLNGRRVDDLFAPEFSSRRSTTLSPSDGLRFGKNHLRVLAARTDGSYDKETRTITVSRRHPLAAAGRDSLRRGQFPIRLNGSRSLPTERKGRLSYSWKLLSAPKGSRATLKNSRTAKPSFVPDELGDYRIRLTATQRGAAKSPASGSDTVTLTSGVNPLPLGIPFDTQGQPNTNPGIQFGDQFFPLNYQLGNAIQALIIDRSSGAVLYHGEYQGSASDAQTLGTQVTNYKSRKPLVILSAPIDATQPGANSSFNKVVQAIGGDPLSSESMDNGGFSVIGIAGSSSGAWENPGYGLEYGGVLQGTLSGYLQLDAWQNLAFVPSRRVPLDTTAPGAPAGQNLITLDGQKFTSGALSNCGSGGFQVEYFGAEFLNPIQGQTFTTNGCGQTADQQAQQAMANFLTSPPGDQYFGLIVAVQSLGNPRGSDDGNWGALANAIGNVGGNPLVFTDDTKSYALLGSTTDPPGPLPSFRAVESSEQETGDTAHITAVLVQGRDGFYNTEEASPTATQFAFDLSVLAYQPSASPLFPDSTTAGDRKALEWIANKLDLNQPTQGSSCYVPAQPDVRSEYCDSKYSDLWGSFATEVQGFTYPGQQAGFSEATFDAIKNDLSGDGYNEFVAVQGAWSAISSLQGAFSTSGQTAAALVGAAGANIKESIVSFNPHTDGEVVVIMADIIGELLAGSTYVLADDDPDVETNIIGTNGLFSSGLFISEDFANDPTGAPALGRFQVSVDDFASELQSNFSSGVSGLSHVLSLILTDSQKLQAFYQGSQYGVNSEYLADLIPVIEFGSARSAYRTLLPNAYGLVHLVRDGINTGINNAQEFQCNYEVSPTMGSNYYPFPQAQGNAQWFPESQHLYVLAAAGGALPDGTHYVLPGTPSNALMAPLFAPYAADSNGFPTAFNFFPNSFYPSAYDLQKVSQVDCG